MEEFFYPETLWDRPGLIHYILLIFNVSFDKFLPKNSDEIDLVVSISQKRFSYALMCLLCLCLQTILLFFANAHVLFSWQWIVVTIKYCINIRILVLYFQMFYLVICQITKWWIPESLNLIQLSSNIKFDVDFGVTAFHVKFVWRVDFVGFPISPSLKHNESSEGRS